MATACGGCGEEKKEKKKKKPDKPKEPVVQKKKDDEAKKLEEAKKDAEKKAGELVLALGDQARFLAAEIEADSKEKRKARPRPKTKSPATGKIDTSAVLKVFEQHESELTKCYERALKRNPSLQGKVTLKVRIESDGSVGSASASSRSLIDQQIFDCMERQASDWSFPQPSGGAAVVRKPFRFQPDI